MVVQPVGSLMEAVFRSTNFSWAFLLEKRTQLKLVTRNTVKLEHYRSARSTGAELVVLGRNGAPGTTRTCDPLIRSQVLYPAELRVLMCETSK